MTRFAVWLAINDAPHLGVLRLRSGIEVCPTDDGVWIQGKSLDEELEHCLCKLPGARRFTVLEDGQLLAVGTVVPKGYLPKGPWQQLRSWLEVQLPREGWPGNTPPPVALRLVRSDQVAEPTLLLANFSDFQIWGSTAAAIRLARLSFALAEDGRVLLRGNPLPPLPGTHWVEDQGIAVPAGLSWTPAVDALVLRQLLRLAADDLAMLHDDGSFDKLRAVDFVRATRSAIRLTAEAAHAG